MKLNIRQVVVVALMVAVPLIVHSQGPERISLGVKGVVWSAPDLDDFSVTLEGMQGTVVYETDETALFGVRPFVRFGLTQRLALELSHEFGFGDNVDIMVSSGSGIWKPFGESGLELHASICYGQFDWDGPSTFDNAWGWEVGAGYSFKLSRSASLVAGVAYRDLSFDYDVEALMGELAATRPDVLVGVSEGSADAAGFLADVGVSITF